MKSFFRNYFKTITHPSESFKGLLADEKYFSLGFKCILFPVVAYTLMYIFLTIGNGAPSVFTPWLNIPRDIYYPVNRFLLAPSMFLAWIACAALVQILSRLFKGNGSFEQTLAVLALSISVAMWGGLIHDLPMSFLSAINVIDARQHEIDMNSPTIFRTLLWICYFIYMIAFFVLFSKTVRIVHNLSRFKSIIIGSSGFVFFQLIFLVFNR